MTYSLWLLPEYFKYALEKGNVALYVFDEAIGFAHGCTVTAKHVTAVRKHGARILCITATPFDHSRTRAAHFLNILQAKEVSPTTEDVRECALRLVVCRPSALLDPMSLCPV